MSEIIRESVKSCLSSNFLPAMLREYKSGWIIEYYIENPMTKKLERKKMKLTRLISRYKSVKDARKHANKIVMEINIRLSTGWNPFFTDDDARLYTSVDVVREKFLQEKKKELREESIQAYSSFVDVFVKWLKNNTKVEYCSMVNKISAVKFMDYVYSERNVSSRTFNNYVKFGRVFFNWAKEKCYTKENPFEAVKTKPKTEKTRTIIPHDTRERVTNYLLSSEEDRNYLVVLKLVYSTLLRPGEIRKLKIENVNLEEKTITVPGSISKNKKKRIVPLTEDVVESLEMLNLAACPTSYFLMGRELKPNSKPLTKYYMAKYWENLREKLSMPKEMQLYSLRDSGISEMLKSGVDPLSVKQHADHHSLAMTTLYSDHVDPNLAKIINEKAPTF